MKTFKHSTVVAILAIFTFGFTFISCEMNKLPFFEQESTDNSEDNEDKPSSDDTIRLKPKTPGLSYDDILVDTLIIKTTHDLLYRYDGYWSMRFDEYFKLDSNSGPKTEWKGIGVFPKGPFDE